MRVSIPSVCCQLAGLFVLSLAHPSLATDSALDAAFTSTISPGITPNAYPSFDSGTGAVNAVALQSDGKIIIGGNISRYKAPPAGSPQSSLKRLNADGTLDMDFDTLASLTETQGQTEVNKLLVTAEDKIYVGGIFQSYGGVPRSGILRLNADGTLDEGFNLAGLSNYNAYGIRYVLAIAEQPDGKVLVGGGFNRLTTPAGSVFMNNLARLNSDGSRDNSFDPAAAMSNVSFVGDIAVLPNRQILVAGGLNKPGGGGTPMLMRLNENGSLDPSFHVAWSSDYGDIDEMLVLPDGRIVIGGDFQFAGGSTHHWVACIHANGTLDTTFMANLGTGPNGWVGGELALQPDGTILAGGIFNYWNGQPRASIARLLPDGTLDNALDVQPYSLLRGQYLTHTYSFAVQEDGKIVMGGWFNRVTDPALETFNLARIMNEYDANSPGTLRMASATARTTELESSISLPVSRFGGLNGAVSVSYSITPGTAVPGTDYTPVSGTLSWTAGEGGVKHIVVPILPDAVADGNRTFTVKLSSPTGGASLPLASEYTIVTIWDDEAPPTVVTSPQNTSLEQGGSFTLRMGYESVLSATVQWQRDTGSGFANIPGALGLSYTVNMADPLVHSGSYRAVVTNANGFSTSLAATVVISIPAGSVVTTFTPPGDTPVVGANTGVAVDPAGRFLLLSSTGLRRMNVDGTLEASGAGGFGISVTGATSVHTLADGRILIGGSLGTLTHLPTGATFSGSARLTRLNANGTIDTGYTPVINGNVTVLAGGAGDTVYVGSSAAATFNGLQRFLADGSVDATFTSGISTAAAVTVYAIKEQPDGKVLVSYTHGSGGSTSYRFSRLTATGALDLTFGTGGTATYGSTWFNGIDVLPDGRIAVTARYSIDILSLHQRYVSILSENGTPDPAFKFYGVFDANPPQGLQYRDGRLLVWGTFNFVNGVANRGLVRLNLDGSVDETFSIGFGSGGGDIHAARYTSTGDIFVAGNFTSFKSVPRTRAALLVGNPHISALGFAPTLRNVVEDAAPLSLTLRRHGSSAGAVSVDYATVDGTALGGTDFTTASGTVSWADGDGTDKTITLNLLDNAVLEATRSFRVTLSNASGPAGAAAGVTVNIIDDDTPVSITTQPVASTTIYDTQAFALSVVASSPSAFTYQWYRNGQAILGATTASINVASGSAADNGVYHVRITNAAGTFLSTPSVVAVRRRPGTLADGQAPYGRPILSPVGDVAALGDGGVLVGGSFVKDLAKNVPQANLIRVRVDGTPDSSFSLPLNGGVSRLLRLPDGRILVAGAFTAIDGSAAAASRLIRLNADLSLDTAFNSAAAPALTTGIVRDMALQSDGSVIVIINNGSTGTMVRLSSGGVKDNTFGVTGTVTLTGGAPTALAVMNDDRIVVAGGFTSITVNGSATSKFRLARMTSAGAVDTTFTNAITGGLGTIGDIIVLADGRLIAGGSSFLNSAALCLVNTDGTFGSNMGSTGPVYQLAQAPGGKLLGTRSSTSSGLRVFRFLGSNPLPPFGGDDFDPSFNIGTGPNMDVAALTVAPDGAVWIAGGFTTFNGVTTGGVVRINGDPVDPGIIAQPAATGAAAGDTAFIGVGAFGTNLAYQWYKGVTPLANTGNISGATSAILAISGMSAADVADYSVVVTNTVSGATVTSAAAHLYLLGAPVVHADVQPVTVDVTQNATLTAQVFALAPATYVWRREGMVVANGGRFSGAGTASLTITGTTLEDTGSYTLTITNAQGQATTAPGFLLVRPIPHERTPLTATLASSVQVNVIHPVPDGSMLVGANGNSNFTGGAGGTSVSGTSLALVRADGSYDASVVVSTVGAVNSIARQSDGKWIIGGDFGSVNGIARNRVARLHADFTLDTTFAPDGTGPSHAVSAVAVDGTGRVYLGGAFTTYDGGGGAGRQFLTRLNANGTRDTTFSLLMNSTISRMLSLADGGILMGGNATSPTNVFRLDASGGLAAGFSGPSLGNVNDLALTPAGDAFYMAYGSTPFIRRYLLSTGELDTSFAVTPVPSNNVNRVAVQADGKVVISGSFATPSYSPMRLLPNGAHDTTFATGANIVSNQITALTVAATGRIWLGGTFNVTYGGTSATRLLVLNGDVPALSFASNPTTAQVEGGQTATFSARVVATATVSYRWYKGTEMVLNGGRFSGADSDTLTITNASVADEGLYTLRATTAQSGTLSSLPAELIFLATPEIVTAPVGGTFEAGLSRTLTVTARGAGTLTYQWFKGNATDGLADIPGATGAAYTLPSPALVDTAYYGVRVTNSLGSTQSTPVLVTFAQYAGSLAAGVTLPTSFNGAVNRLIPLSDGTFVAQGGFSTIQQAGDFVSTGRRHLARILTDGKIDTAFPFAPNTSSHIYDCVRDSQGRFIIAGNFTTLNRTGGNITRNYIARVNQAGEVDTNFVSPFSAHPNAITTLALDANDNVYVGGSFYNFTGFTGVTYSARYLVRLNATTGALDTSFAVTDNLGTVNVVRPLADGTVLVGCQYPFYMVRLTSTGARDTSFTYLSSLTVTDIMPVPGSTDYLICGTSIQRITANGALVSPWPATGTAATGVTDLIHTGDHVLAGGTLTSYNSLTINRMAAIGTDGVLSSTYRHGTGFNNSVNTFALDGSGRVWVGGNFTDYRGTAVGRVVVLNSADTIPADPGAPVSGFESYLIAAGVPEGQRGDTDDPDKDGISNLLEYALGLPPNTPSANGLPTGVETPPWFSLTYRRLRSELTYVVEQSGDLTPESWTPVGVDQGTPLPDGTTTGRIPMTGSRGFLRLSVTR